MTTAQTGMLLTPEERATCERVSGANDAPHSQRAQALLAVDEGLSQASAGERAGLTLGQVRYCLRQFRQHQLGIFPEHLQSQTDSVPAAPAAEQKSQPVVQPEPEPVAEAALSASPAEVAKKDKKESEKVKEKKKPKQKKAEKKKGSKKDKKKKSKKKKAKKAKKSKK